jgi:predicted PolB exonuclease-like 3'-5' exonuclease
VVIAVLDIETAPLLAIGPEESPEDIKKLSLSAIDARVVAIALLLVDHFEAKLGIVWSLEDETRMLREFWDEIRTRNVSKFVVHNGLSFDLPFLWRRSVIHKVQPTRVLDLKRYKTDAIYDTMTVWGNWEPRSYVSLGSLSAALDLGEKSEDGGSVARIWEERNYSRLSEYCLHDAWLTYGCWCRMNFQNPIHKNKIAKCFHIEQTCEAVLAGASA